MTVSGVRTTEIYDAVMMLDDRTTPAEVAALLSLA